MTESLERELELVKLQIAAGNCLAGVQIYVPLAFGGVVVLSVFAFSAMMQYPNSSIIGQLFILIAVALMVLLSIILWLARREYQDGIRNLDVYVEDFRAGKPLPSVITMCGLKEKKVKS